MRYEYDCWVVSDLDIKYIDKSNILVVQIVSSMRPYPPLIFETLAIIKMQKLEDMRGEL